MARSFQGSGMMSEVTASGMNAFANPAPEPISSTPPSPAGRQSRIIAYQVPYTRRSSGFDWIIRRCAAGASGASGSMPAASGSASMRRSAFASRPVI
jgi:hypothetical protein